MTPGTPREEKRSRRKKTEQHSEEAGVRMLSRIQLKKSSDFIRSWCLGGFTVFWLDVIT
jgi:hypothetical protein